MALSRIPNSIVVANGKGGTGKTTVAANLAHEAARRGALVTMLDLDPQSNLANEFGVTHDNGRSLLAASMGLADQPTIFETGRQNLRMIIGGPEINKLVTLAMVEHRGNPAGLAAMIHDAVAPILRPGEWLFIDTPPASGGAISDAAFLIGQNLLIPAKRDRDGRNGVNFIFSRCLELAKDGSDMINILGVVLFAIPLRATRLNKELEDKFKADLNNAIQILHTKIRQTENAETQAKELGLIASEYAELAGTTAVPKWYEALKTGQEVPNFGSNGDDLAGDYRDLADEIAKMLDDPGTAR